jgi:hypothetical protein
MSMIRDFIDTSGGYVDAVDSSRMDELPTNLSLVLHI